MNPKATIMIPSYNVEKFIGGTLESAVNQTYKEYYEILVVNDGSTDDTQGIIEWWGNKDERIRLINQKNGGTSVARNRLLDESRGDIVFGLDADDIVHPDALEKIIDIYKKCPKIDHVYTNQLEIDELGKLLRERLRSEVSKFSDKLTYHCHFQGHMKSFRKSLIGNHRFDEGLKSAVDWDFFLQLYSHATIFHLPEILYSYRMNQRGISATDRAQVRQNSVNLIKKYVGERGFYGGEFDVVPVRVGERCHYYNHIVNGKSMIDSEAEKVLLRYLRQGK